MKLSIGAARDLKPGQTLKCDVVRGLELRGRAGVKSWHFYHRVAGVQRRPKLGEWPTLSIEAARIAAKAMALQVAKGEDPSATRQVTRGAPGMRDLYELYWTDHVLKKNKPTTQDQARGIWTKYVLPALGPKKVADVTVADVAAMLSRIGRKKPFMANRVKSYLRKAFAIAEKNSVSWRPKGSNPCRDEDIPVFRERRRKRHIEAAEFAALHASLQKMAEAKPRHVAAIYSILYAGSRVSELAQAKRHQLDGTVVRLSEHKTDKSLDERTIRLPRQAVALLASAPPDPSGLLFGAGIDRFSLAHVFAACRKDAGISNLSLRDLRRTFASVAVTLGASLDQIGEVFDHKSTNTTARYAWLFDEEAVDIVQRTADKMDELMQRKAPG